MIPAEDLRLIERNVGYRMESRTGKRTGGLLAIVFAGPWTHTLGQVALHVDYLNELSGGNLDIYFAGTVTADPVMVRDYYDHEIMPVSDRQEFRETYYRRFGGRDHRRPDYRFDTGPRRAGREEWWWSPKAFNDLRREVESLSKGSWTYSGSSDLVLINVVKPLGEPVVIDWESAVGVSLSARDRDTQEPVDIYQVVQRLVRSIELADPDNGLWGLSNLVPVEEPPVSRTRKAFKFFVTDNLVPAIIRGFVPPVY